jgi:hypothetical protein
MRSSMLVSRLVMRPSGPTPRRTTDRDQIGWPGSIRRVGTETAKHATDEIDGSLPFCLGIS